MSIKDDELYPLYISFLESKRLSTGALKLAKISNVMFNDFINRYESSPDFKQKQDNIYRSIKRDITIDEILDDKDEFEIFLDDLNLKTSKSSNEEDDFFDF